jgi:hypothetical protein
MPNVTHNSGNTTSDDTKQGEEEGIQRTKVDRLPNQPVRTRKEAIRGRFHSTRFDFGNFWLVFEFGVKCQLNKSYTHTVVIVSPLGIHIPTWATDTVIDCDQNRLSLSKDSIRIEHPIAIRFTQEIHTHYVKRYKAAQTSLLAEDWCHHSLLREIPHSEITWFPPHRRHERCVRHDVRVTTQVQVRFGGGHTYVSDHKYHRH